MQDVHLNKFIFLITLNIQYIKQTRNCIHVYNIHTIDQNLSVTKIPMHTLHQKDNHSFSIFNTLRPRQNGHHFANNILKYNFLNENVQISLKISLRFVPKIWINNIPALVQIMAWCLQAIIWIKDGQSHRCIYESLGFNELKQLWMISLQNLNSLRPSDAYMRQ